MSAIPYSINRLSDGLGWPKEFYKTAFEVLTKYNALQFALPRKPDNLLSNVENEKIYFVLKHVIFRTLPFQKAFEFVRWGDVTNGIPGNAIAGCNISEKTVQRVLDGLAPPHGELLVKLRLSLKGRRIVTPLYGINLPLFLEMASLWAEVPLNEERVSKDEFEDRPNRKPSNLFLEGRCFLDRCVEFTEVFKPAFKFLTDHSQVIEDVETFAKQWQRHFPPKDEVRSDFSYQIKQCRNVRALRTEYLAELHETEERQKKTIETIDLREQVREEGARRKAVEEKERRLREIIKHPVVYSYLEENGVIKGEGEKMNLDNVRAHLTEIRKRNGKKLTFSDLLAYCGLEGNAAQ